MDPKSIKSSILPLTTVLSAIADWLVGFPVTNSEKSSMDSFRRSVLRTGEGE
jgi:hypothetical protein